MVTEQDQMQVQRTQPRQSLRKHHRLESEFRVILYGQLQKYLRSISILRVNLLANEEYVCGRPRSDGCSKAADERQFSELQGAEVIYKIAQLG